MRRGLRIVLWIVAVLVALPVLAVAVLLVALNTGAGQRLAASQVAGLTGGMVRLDGVSGRFPDRLRLARLEIRDAAGRYVSATGVALDWSPLALLHRQALVHRLDAETLTFARLPQSQPAAPAPAQPAAPFQLPVRVTVEHLGIARATVGAPLLGSEAVLALSGSADLPSLEAGTADIEATAPGARYVLHGSVAPDRIQATLGLDEAEGGLIARLASLPAIGALHLDAAATGPRGALATTLALTAGPLAANATGLVDLDRNAATLDVTAKAPAMRPAPGVAWRGIDLQAHVAGPFTAPDATGRLRIDAPEAAGVALGSIAADVSGNAGQVSLAASLTALRLPEPAAGLFAGTPIRLDATARLDDPARPVRFSVAHPLLSVTGTARTAGDPAADASVTLPDLAPLAALGGQVLAGRATIDLHATQAAPSIGLEAKAAVTLTAGDLLPITGPDIGLALAGSAVGSDVTVRSLTLTTVPATLAAAGRLSPAAIDLTAKLAVPDLARLAPRFAGAATVDAHLLGPPDALAVQATASGDVGGPGFARAPLRLVADLTGVPSAPAGHIAGTGTLAGAPVALDLTADRDASGAVHAHIGRADWRSLHAEGDVTLPPGATVPQGRVALRFDRLEDLQPLIGQHVAGAVTADAVLDPTTATVSLEARGAGIPGSSVGHATLKARIADPTGRPVVTASLAADGIAAAGVTGAARLEAAGPQDALALRTTATLDLAGTPTQITGAATLDATAQQLHLTALGVIARNETLRLLAPATIRFADAIAVDRLRLGLRQATLDVAGRLSPTLDATVALRAPADLASLADPALAMDGSITLDAKLTGPPARPGGTARLTATGVRLRTGPGRAVPAATLDATARLNGAIAQLDARLSAGTASLAVAGQVPTGPGALALRARGGLDLTLLDPILTAQGRRARGRVALDAAIAGPLAAPRLSGQAQLTDGEVQDFSQGLRITALAATIRADGDTVRIASLTGRAGPGTIAASGTVGVLAPSIPVDLAITLRNARPLASDLLTADLDADITVKGAVQTGLQAGGRVLIRRAELQIPSTLPASVAVLDVRRPGDKPPAAPASAATPVRLDLAIDAPQGVFIRGRGVTAEMGGTLRLRGLSTAPQVGGGLEMRRGAVSIAGTTLTFTRGRVGFDGTGLSGKIDPTLDFAADSTAGGVTATLAIGGYVSKPKITLTSVPDLPQDEVLAYLIFKRSAKELGPFQIAQIAAGLAELSGVTGGGGFNPLESVRKGLGLDRLSIGSSSAAGSTTSNPTVEGGRYVANGVYVGAKQGATGGSQTQATVQIDITKGLKLEADVGSGQGGNQVGVTYQFEY